MCAHQLTTEVGILVCVTFYVHCVFCLAADTLIGESLQIIYFDEDSCTFKLDVELLEKVLLSEEVRNMKVMVLSVAGTFRQGKSFLLNFFIKYLKAVEFGDSEVYIYARTH